MVTGCGITGSDGCESRREDVKDLLLIGLLIINFSVTKSILFQLYHHGILFYLAVPSLPPFYIHQDVSNTKLPL